MSIDSVFQNNFASIRFFGASVSLAYEQQMANMERHTNV